ncbi:MAG: NADH-quinone oxidoreductase subunit N [Desulfobacula sp.]|nr:NADH-quinone oxidoreductase subunit N [Desulfobacula sp.]
MNAYQSIAYQSIAYQSTVYQSTVYQSIPYIIPELILTGTMILIIVISFWEKFKQSRLIITAIAVTGLFLSIFSIPLPDHNVGLLFGGMLSHDSFAGFFKMIVLICTLFTFLAVYESYEIKDSVFSEFSTILLSCALGLCFFISSVNFLMLYLSLEFVSITSYVLTGFKKQNRRSSEAALKYAIYGGVVSGIMLFGISYFYGLLGTLDIFTIKQGLVLVFSQGTTPVLKLAVLCASLFTFAGIGYKIAAVPFHMWSPDVYEGAPTPFIAFLSVAPKLAGIAVLIRFVFTGFVVDNQVVANIPWPQILGLLSVITMTLGNLCALAQKNIKRLLAYSGIAHCGYLLMGVSAISHAGIFSVNFYALIYLFMNLGAFVIVIAIREETGSEEIKAYAGLSSRSPFLGIALSIFLLSLAGVPPFAGFIAKFYLFSALIDKGSSLYYMIAVAGILNSVIALYYYVVIVKVMFFEKPEFPSPCKPSPIYTWIIIALLIPVLVFGVYWQPVAIKASQAIPF